MKGTAASIALALIQKPPPSAALADGKVKIQGKGSGRVCPCANEAVSVRRALDRRGPRPALQRSKGEIGFVVEEAVFVADYDQVGPARSRCNQEPKIFGGGRQIEGQLRGVGIGRFERREQWSAFDGDGCVIAAGGVDE